MSDTTSTTLKVLIADDHAMILEMFEHYLANIPDIEVATAPDLDAALDRLAGVTQKLGKENR